MRTKRHKLSTKTVAEAPAAAQAAPAAPGASIVPDEPSLIRVSDAAHTLGVSENSIRAYVKQQLLEQVRIGTRTVRITRGSLMKLMGQPAE